jgi:hypothetical protein
LADREAFLAEALDGDVLTVARLLATLLAAAFARLVLVTLARTGCVLLC